MTINGSKQSPVGFAFRLPVGLIGLLFLLLGLGFISFPDTFAAAFSVQPLSVQGLNAIRGDLGGLFLGMGFFCLLGAVTGFFGWLIVPVLFLLMIMAGRLISLGLDGFSETGLRSLAIEAIAVGVLMITMLIGSRQYGSGASRFSLSDLLNPKILAGGAVILAILAGLLLSQKQIGMRMVDRVAIRIMETNAAAGLPDGLHVAIVGSGAPFADPRRAGPSTAVIVAGKLYIVDAGPGSVRKLELMKFKPEDVRAVLLTHYHSDHIGDLGELMLKRWAGGNMAYPLDIFGPVGVETVVKGFNLAYSLDSEYRVLHHGPEVVPPSGAGGIARRFDFPADQTAAVILEEDGLTVTAFLVDHAPVSPAVGYRFDYKGRSAVVSGDTVVCPPLLENIRNIDLLVQDAPQPAMVALLEAAGHKIDRPLTASIMGDILHYHTSPEDAARIARDAQVGHLLLTHILPPLPVADLKPAFLGDAKKHYPGPITLGEDGMLLSLPADSKKILKRRLL
jgi:ribonuclease Z